MKPDRFARMADKYYPGRPINAGFAAKLLRSEHKAVVRLVTRMSKGQGETKSAPRETEEWMSSESWLDGYFHACNEMLATLARRVK